MTRYLTRWSGYVDVGVWVEADESVDAWELSDLAYDNLPGICAQCSGWGKKNVFMELSDAFEPYSVEDEDGTVLVEEDTELDLLRKDNQQLSMAVKNLLNEIRELKEELGR